MLRISRVLVAAAFTALLAMLPWRAAVAAEPVKIGLITALSGQSALAGQAISRGVQLAIDEINANGGVLGGRELVLVRRDDESNPAKGVVAARELIHKEKVAVLFGGLDTPVALAIVPLANQAKMPFMDPWAAGTPITKNGADPNFVFRVSAMDELVDVAMVEYAQKNFGSEKFGLLMINNPWGESNHKGLVAALDAKGMKPAGSEKFDGDAIDVVPQLTRLRDAGADTIALVGNVGPSAQVVKSLRRMGWDVPIVSHWGPAGGRFTELAGPGAEKVHFVQTYSFFGDQSPVGKKVIAALTDKYDDINGPADITPAVGVANAYDAMHLTALAIDNAGSTDGEAIREGYFEIDTYPGLIKTYKDPFSKEQHDALGPQDYVWAQFIDNRIVPVGLQD
ncbi:ABC transporter substrate-binding protein [Alloalcanivorax gelatiniphagus]|uniref:Ethanolamine utilization protein EutN n=1 Tax=Alloalcanivorax gelatiniphagus TaxID=1194167 RepID=A0ABY2XGI8_9GAMM|nr:ABC transporter substrate-binding protein [Alloalcanivorax gelatiniphagus]TMW10782.1 ethanolamine utilization protein EutN [Alloalcanivorax gelatiniphagus]|tara:strand:- start:10769 stop:11953 length:1185 start_codon:yes stop_codon:yes gene_type:complete